mmetsp:Transcript_127528/g.397057  ORF Transcript_127528/g.397057 Transcript_127528/m.397057 type:complete len:236 (+) Transcript_127528:528-1235(+)
MGAGCAHGVVPCAHGPVCRACAAAAAARVTHECACSPGARGLSQRTALSGGAKCLQRALGPAWTAGQLHSEHQCAQALAAPARRGAQGRRNRAVCRGVCPRLSAVLASQRCLRRRRGAARLLRADGGPRGWRRRPGRRAREDTRLGGTARVPAAGLPCRAGRDWSGRTRNRDGPCGRASWLGARGLRVTACKLRDPDDHHGSANGDVRLCGEGAGGRRSTDGASPVRMPHHLPAH